MAGLENAQGPGRVSNRHAGKPDAYPLGYSLDGRQRGTSQIYQALCAYLGQDAPIHLADLLPRAWLAVMRHPALSTQHD